GMLPYPAGSLLGYRLLTEFFAFPEKFQFVELDGLRGSLDQIGRRLEVFFYLDQYTSDLERNVSAASFQLGCTPVVNLFAQRAEPIRLTHTEPEYRVLPDARRPAAHEVFSVDSVTATSPDGERKEYRPFYAARHGGDVQDRAFWLSSRRSAGFVAGEADQGTEVFLSLVDLDFRPAIAENWTLSVETTCLSRDLPGRLPFGGGQPQLKLVEPAPVSAVRCLTPPTPTRRPALRHGTRWRLISHLTLGHLSLCDGDEGADALREILALYDFTGTAETRALVEGIERVSTRPAVGRVGGPIAGGLCRGTEVTLRFDEEKYTGSGVFLLASVLERFLALYCSINSFTQLVATTNRREGALKRWPPRAGEQALL
ncbi:MAG: type VI secretion system baseplate subunit TssF, partial [Planctomycetaceae bacterium]